MLSDSPPWESPAAVRTCGGGSRARRIGKTGEIQRRKATELRYQPDIPSGGCYVRRAALSKAGEILWRKGMGPSPRQRGMAARPPDTLHPNNCKGRKIIMKKRNTHVLRRLLAVALALNLGVSTMAISVSAYGGGHGGGGGPGSGGGNNPSRTETTPDPEDYVYVYINVEPENVEEKDADEGSKPTFDAEGTDKVLAETKKEADDAKVNPDDKPVFDEDGKTTGALQEAIDKANEELGELEGTDKPTYSQPSETEPPSEDEENEPGTTEPGTTEPETTEPETTEPSSDTPAAVTPAPVEESGETGSESGSEPENPTFADQIKDTVNNINDRVEDLNEAKSETDTAVQGGLKDADEAQKAVQEAKTKLDEALNELQSDFESKKSTAEEKVAEAEEYLKTYEETMSARETELQNDLNTKLAEAEALKPSSETAPVRQEGQSEEEYVAQYDAWVAASTAYNNKLTELQTAYEAAKKELSDKYEEAKKEVADAQNAFKEASDALTLLLGEKDGEFYKTLEGLDAPIKAYNDAVNAYNAKVEDYNAVAKSYNDAADAVDKAVGDYNEAVGDHNTAAGEYNDKVDTYYDKVEAYEEAIGNYNEKVDAYNDSAADWNSAKVEEQNNAVDMSSDDAAVSKLNDAVSKFNDKAAEDQIADQLANITNEDIQVYREVVGMLTAEADPATEEETSQTNSASALTNDQIAAYNKVVKAYNAAIDQYNQNLVNEKLDQVRNYFDPEARHEANGDYWYTVGKFDVKGIFSGKPEDLKDNYLDNNKKDYNADETDLDAVYDNYNFESASESNRIYYGRDIYYFDKVNGQMSSTPSSANWKEGTEDKNLYADGKTQADLLNALNRDNLDAFKTLHTGTGFDPATDINRWVLKVSYGANDYVEETSGKETFHLDGYLYVQQLSKLALLEERAVKSETHDLTEEQWSELRADDQVATLTGVPELDNAETYDVYWNVMEPIIQEPESDDELDVEDPYVPTYEVITEVPDNITITPRDTTTPPPPVVTPEPEPDPVPPTTGGGGGGGGAAAAPAPVAEIADEATPLAELPEEVAEIAEEEVPLAELPAEEEAEIMDEEVPLADIPHTGDISAVWYLSALISAAGLAMLTFKRKEEGQEG